MAMSDTALAAVAKEELERLLYQMVLIRRFEEKAAEMYARGRIHGFLHLYIGQEAIATGAISRLRPEDYVITHYREHAHAIARGLETKGVMAELFGKQTGSTKGRGGSMHLFDVTRRFMGGYAIVGSHLPLACGLALGCQEEGQNGVVCCFLGDGAINEGAFHESLNLAAVWRLPILFVCENNFYAMGTLTRNVSGMSEIYKRAEAYGMKAEQLNGMDVLEVHAHIGKALESVRAGNGPFFLEATTYRYRGHSMADPELYRSKEEVQEWRAQDPISAFTSALLAGNTLSQGEIDAITGRVEEEVRDAVEFAEQSSDPDLGSLYDNVYAGPNAPLNGWRGGHSLGGSQQDTGSGPSSAEEGRQ